jgi:hypothetical protein
MKLPRSSPPSVNSASYTASRASLLRPGTVFDMPRVDQQHLHRAFGLAQSVKDRLPINPRRFHGHVRDTLRHQPGHHFESPGVSGDSVF